MRIAVYLGSSFGDDPQYRESVRELGNWIGSHGHTLVYGGNSHGLMGVLADAVKESGGYLIGVEPAFISSFGVPYAGLDEVVITKDMNERKAKMIELAEHFIACPGGMGTLDEITEVITLKGLRQLQGEVFLFNVNGYYEGLMRVFDNMVRSGFLAQVTRDQIHCADSVKEIEEILEGLSFITNN